MKIYLSIVFTICAAVKVYSQPTISFTFDDGQTTDMPGYTFEQWNKMLLDHLDHEKVKAVFFVTGFNKTDNKGQFLLKSWSDKGHKIGNHSFSHPNYNSSKISFKKFRDEFYKTDSIINKYSSYIRLFRFPYLKEGETKEKVDQFRILLKENNYNNGSVTIDASDWYVDSRLRNRLKENPQSTIEGFKQFYLSHIYERAMYYEELAFKLTGRHINHTLLLHHNLTSALFLGDLIKMFKVKGWKIMDGESAFKDEIFQAQPTNVPAGESLLWALAKETGSADYILRFPGEDSKYEKDKMDKLGL